MNGREAALLSFLGAAGWASAERRFLAGDASNRSYDRLTLPDGSTAVLMDAPPGKGEDIRPFLKIAAHLRGLGLSAPRSLAADATLGFLLLEDLGDGLYARVLERCPEAEVPLYEAATGVLVHLQAHAAPAGLAAYDTAAMVVAARLAPEWYCRAILGDAGEGAAMAAALETALDAHAADAPVIVLRDYHAENMLWLDGRDGLARVGLLDFQLAQLGQPGYDLVSMLQDARRDVPAGIEDAMIARFARLSGRSAEGFATSCAVLGAQRALRILGTFARLSLLHGKPGYVRLIPRVWAQLRRNLEHPALSDLRRECDRLLPEPTDDGLRRMTELCGTFRTR